MDATTQSHIENIHSHDKQAQNEAYYALMEATEQPVDWAYEVWDGLVADLSHKDNHVRAIAAQLLCNLAQSDPDKRMQQDFAALLHVTRDERFVTARHCMQHLWKVGRAGPAQRQMLLDGLTGRFADCRSEKNWSLIRHDILKTLRDLYDDTGDDAVKTQALALIEQEDDAKYRKKYAGVWKSA